MRKVQEDMKRLLRCVRDTFAAIALFAALLYGLYLICLLFYKWMGEDGMVPAIGTAIFIIVLGTRIWCDD